MSKARLTFLNNSKQPYPAWSMSLLKDAVEINPKTESLPNQFVYIDLEAVQRGTLISTKIYKKQDAPSRAQRLLKANDVLFQMVRPYQKNNYFFKLEGSLPTVSSTGYAQFRAKNNCQKFIYYTLHTEKFVRNVLDRCTGGTYPAINSSDLGEIVINIPCKEEQQKIAALFTALDEKIACETKIVEKVKLIKKCCLQKIFNEEVHFRDSTPWVKTSFGAVATFVNGRAYAQDELLSHGKYLVLRVGNFFTSSDYYYSDLELDDDKYANDGDLLYAWSASFGPRIWHGGKVIYHYHIWKVIPKSIDKNFLFYALQSDVDEMKCELNGGTMSHLTKSGIEGRVLKIPCEAEQKEIGEFLQLLDEKIAIASRRLEVLVRQKKSFLQQMFI